MKKNLQSFVQLFKKIGICVVVALVMGSFRPYPAQALLGLPIIDISGIAVTQATDTSAVIVWSTNMPTSGRVDYGLTTNYTYSSQPTLDLLLVHTELLSGLEPNTTYHYRITSTDLTGDTAVSGDQTFTTLCPLLSDCGNTSDGGNNGTGTGSGTGSTSSGGTTNNYNTINNTAPSPTPSNPTTVVVTPSSPSNPTTPTNTTNNNNQTTPSTPPSNTNRTTTTTTRTNQNSTTDTNKDDISAASNTDPVLYSLEEDADLLGATLLKAPRSLVEWLYRFFLLLLIIAGLKWITQPFITMRKKNHQGDKENVKKVTP